MSKAGKRLLRGAYQALAYAEGKAEPETYRVHYPDVTRAEISEQNKNLDDADAATDKNASEDSVHEKAGTRAAVLKPQAASDSSAAGQ